MKIISEKELRGFDFWSGAKDNAKLLTFKELDMIEEQLEDIKGEEGYTATEINDMFWFDFEYILEMLGLTEEDLEDRE